MAWAEVGTVSFKPSDFEVDVGSFALAPGADTLWIRIVDETGVTPWPFSYGIVSFRTANGKELGSTKAYSSQSGEVFRLGVGLPPSDRNGMLTFEPRGFNLAWVDKGNSWTLRFECQSGAIGGSGGSGGGGVVAYRVTDGVNDVPWLYDERGLAVLDF